MTRYFPELVAAIRAELPERCVIDGEIVIPDAEGRRLDFEALQLRIHPAASRVELLSTQTPGHFIAFDLLALGDSDYMERPFAERRAALEGALAAAGPSSIDPTTTTDREVASGWFSQFEGAGLDGLIAKPTGGIYELDKRVMLKVKHERTADCVVAADRVHKSGEDRIGSLLLGLYKDDGKLASVGVVGAFGMQRRKELFAELQPLVTTFEAHPWNWAEHQAGQRTPRWPWPAGGTRTRTCRSSRCARSAWSRSATTTWRACGSGTRRSSSAGGRTASRVRAPTPSWRSRSASTSPRSCGAAPGSGSTASGGRRG